MMNLLTLECAILVVRLGAESAALRASRGYDVPPVLEPNLNQILKHAVVRVLRPLAARFVESAARSCDTIPRWVQI